MGDVKGGVLLSETIGWIIFGVLVFVVLALDLGIFNRRAHEPSFREALIWSIVWVALAGVFGVYVFFALGAHPALEYLTAYLVEKSLAVDNVFLFAVVFTQFAVERRYQHRVLFWGIIGAIVMRGILIAAGTTLIARFHWLTYAFGVLIIATGIKMFFHRNEEVDVSRMRVVRWLRKHIRLTGEYEGQRFFTRQDGVLYATPLLLVLVVIEFTDLVFAVDSIPAVLAISRDPFIVFTSNVFAILGLRAFYFLLAGVLGMFEYLSLGLSAVLIYIGFKMMGWIKVSPGVSLAVVATLLTIAVVASVVKRRVLARREAAVRETTPITTATETLTAADRSGGNGSRPIVGVDSSHSQDPGDQKHGGTSDKGQVVTVQPRHSRHV